MRCKKCKKPVIIKNKFKSTIVGTIGIYFGFGYVLPMSYLSVYITSYIHIKQNFVNMHYGYFLNLILTLAMTFCVSLGGLLENKLGYTFTTLLGTIIIFITNFFFFKIQNIWICYFLTLLLGVGAGITTSLLGKNLALYRPNKKGLLVSLSGMALTLITGLFLLIGEKIISPSGDTLGENEEVYKPETAERTYLYFMLGFFTIPIGDIIFLLFAHEYKKPIELDLIIPEDNIENENIINDIDDDNENKEEQKEEHVELINEVKEEEKQNKEKSEEDEKITNEGNKKEKEEKQNLEKTKEEKKEINEVKNGEEKQILEKKENEQKEIDEGKENEEVKQNLEKKENDIIEVKEEKDKEKEKEEEKEEEKINSLKDEKEINEENENEKEKIYSEKEEKDKHKEKEERKEKINSEKNEKEQTEINDVKEEEVKLNIDKKEEEQINDIYDTKFETEKRKRKIKKIIKTFRFWKIAIASLLLSFPISFMMTTGRTFGALIGIKGAALQFSTIAQGAAIIIVGPIFGILSDKKGPLLILRISSIVSILPGILLLFFIDNTVLYMISFVFMAIGLVSKTVSFNPFLMEIYGIRESVILGGIINGIGKVGEVITVVAAFVIPFKYQGNEIKTPYKIIFIVGSACSLLSLILLLFESTKKYEYEEEMDKLDLLIDNDNLTENEQNNGTNNNNNI